MSDPISIPGVTNRFNTQSMVTALVEAERAPITRMQADVDGLQTQKSAWQDLNRHLGVLREAAQSLHGFRNPFQDKTASSSDPLVITATATREAFEDSYDLVVKQVARPDKFRSNSVARNFEVKPGTYTFRVGTQDVQLPFGGGSLTQFAQTLNQQSGGILKASVFNDAPGTSIFSLQSTMTGEENKLALIGQAEQFGVDVGMVRRVESHSRDIQLLPTDIESRVPGADRSLFHVNAGVLTLEPGASVRIPLQPGMEVDSKFLLQFDARVVQLPEEPYVAAVRPPGPSVNSPGAVVFEGFTIQNQSSELLIPEWRPPEPPRRVQDLNVVAVEDRGRSVAVPALQANRTFTTQQVRIGELAGRVDALTLVNNNTYRQIEVRGVRIYDQTARGNTVPVSPVSEASDAVVQLEGIDLRRPSNSVDDLLPGVTLQLVKASPQLVTLEIGGNVEAAKSGIINLVGSYNRLLTEIDILTRADSQVIVDANYLTEDERVQAEQRLGMLRGDSTLVRMKNTLQDIMMNPYVTSGGNQLALLSQMGISTGALGGGVDRSRLRGYLEIDEAALDTSLREQGTWVRQLFGNDTDSDLLVDTGIAYLLDQMVRPYSIAGGVVSTRLSTIDGSVARKTTDIERAERRLEDFEADTRQRFAQMEAALDQLQQSSQTIRNFSNNNR